MYKEENTELPFCMVMLKIYCYSD